jgi:hypothetical protein
VLVSAKDWSVPRHQKILAPLAPHHDGAPRWALIATNTTWAELQYHDSRHRSRYIARIRSPITTSAMSSLDPPTYLTSIQNNIRARPISWEGAVRAKTITDEDLKKIKSIDKVRKEQRKQTIESDVDSFVTLLVGGNGSQSIFEAAAKRQDIIHYMLVLLGDMIDGRSLETFLDTRRSLYGSRHTCAHVSSGPTPSALQAFLTTFESFIQQRRPRTAANIFCSLWHSIPRCYKVLQEHTPAR